MKRGVHDGAASGPIPRTAFGGAAAIAAIALAAGCCPARAPDTPIVDAPPGSCKAAWASVPAAKRAYDWVSDAKRTPRGNEGYASFAERLPRRGCKKAWTVLVYMAADADDLGEPALRDIAAMEATGSTDEADVIVQLDRRQPAGIVRLHALRAPAGSPPISSPIVEAFDEETIAPDESLRRFVSWGVERYPSEHYAVIVWGHGLGWRPAPSAPAASITYSRESDSGGIAFDDTQGTVLDTPGLKRALVTASREKLGGKPFDLYASDACLMQSIEVAAELDGAARFVVGSEQIEEDYVGLPYGTWLPLLGGSAAFPAVSSACAADDLACRAAAALPDLQRAAAESGADPQHASDGFTLSTVDEAALTREALPAMRRLAGAIDAYLAEDPLRRAGLEALLGPDHGPLRGTPSFRGGTRDIGAFLARLDKQIAREPGAAGTRGQKGVSDAIAAARVAIGRAVIAASFGARLRAKGSDPFAGLSVWLPRDAQDRARVDFFATSALYRSPAGEPSFRAFLDRLFR
jgi:hypothetical protein